MAETSTPSMRSDGRGNQSVQQWPDGSKITVGYNGFARLTRYKVGVATQDMLYNGEDERIRVVTTPAVGPSDTRIYMYDLDHRIVGEYGGAGVTDVKAEYIWTLLEVDATGPTGGDDGTGGYMPLAIIKGAASDINWVHSHHNGAPILMANSAGAIVPHGDHAVMGFPGQFANAKQLAGAQHYYNRYRDYNPVTGRYIQADPIGLAGDDNPYAYAMGNALRYSDPTGEFVPFIVAGACAGGGCQGAAIATGALIGGAIAWIATHPIVPWSDVGPPPTPFADPNCPDWRGPVIHEKRGRRPPSLPSAGGEEHTKNARPSTKGRHEAGNARRGRDRGGERADANRRPPLKRPPNHRGPWPPR